jgi:hypothetical protein
MRLALLFSGFLTLAPLQCGSEPDPDRRLEDSPEEALMGLADRMREEGDEDGRRRTLEYLIERYPSSREAEQARLELGR